MKVHAEVLKSATLLSESADALIYRASMHQYGGDVMLKVLKAGSAETQLLARLNNEYDALMRLNVRGVQTVYDRITINQHPALVLEYIPGSELYHFIRRQLPSISTALNLAVQLCQTLEGIHAQNLLHGGLNSRRIVLNEEHELFLLDFGQAVALPLAPDFELQGFLNEDTLPYLAPELSGKLQAPIDSRADLYSLGVVLYELFTGELPFLAASPQAMLHAHLALQPEAPHLRRPELSPVLSDILLKLLAKNPNERYQSAFGLRQDLENCLQMLHTGSAIVPFALGEYDNSGKLQAPQRLTGRQEELALLQQLWQQVTKGANELLWVGGPVGSGKSALIGQLQDSVLRQRGYFLSGKFEAHQQNRPYAAWLASLEELIEIILTKEQDDLSEWRERITLALGAEGRLITNILPRLSKVIGEQPNVPELEGLEAQNRFLFTFRNFLGALSSEQHPLLIFLDDLQWADPASLNLLRVFMEEGGSPYLLLVASYSQEEVAEESELKELLHRPMDNLLQVTRLQLQNLSETQLNDCLAALLNKGSSIARPLGRLLYTKTGGNPLFFMQFLKSVCEAGYLRFDRVKTKRGGGQWSWELEAIARMPQSENILSLLQKQIMSLAGQQHRLLQQAACLGMHFRLDELSRLNEEYAEGELSLALYSLIQEGLLFEEQHAVMQLSGRSFRFAHERIRQAVYELLPDTEKQAFHYLIGQLLESSSEEANPFDLINHWKAAENLLSVEERIRLAGYYQQAARQVSKSSAYSQGLQFLQESISLLPATAWKTGYALTLAVYSQACEAAFLCGEYAKMEAYAKEVLQFAQDKLDQVKVQEVKMLALIAQNKSSQAVHVAVETLAGLNVNFPARPDRSHILADLVKTEIHLLPYTQEKLKNLPEMTDRRALAIMQLMTCTASAVFRSSPLLFPHWVCKMIRFTLRYGNALQSIPAYSAYGYLKGALLAQPTRGLAYGELAYDLLKEQKARAVETKVHFVVATFLQIWTQPLRDTLLPLHHAYQTGLETGDQQFAAQALSQEFIHEFIAGEPLTALANKIDEYNGQVRQLKQELISAHVGILRQALANLQNPGGISVTFQGDYYSEEVLFEQEGQNAYKSVFYRQQLLLLMLNYLNQQPEEALVHAEALREHVGKLVGSIFQPFYYFYQALAFADSKAPEVQVRRQLKVSLTKMKKWAESAPMNYQHKYDLLKAEYLRLLGKKDAARSYYDRAIQAAHEHLYLQDEALAYELAARFMFSEHQEVTAELYLQKAYLAYQRWGSEGKLAQLRQKYPLRFSKLHAQTSAVHSSEASQAIGSLLEASQAIAGNTRLDAVLQSLLKVLMQLTGGRRACILLDREEGLQAVSMGMIRGREIELLEPGNSHDLASLPSSIINYTFRTGQELVLHDALDDKRFSADVLIQQQQIRSVFCLPIAGNARLRGLVYLENSIAAGAFSEQQIQAVRLLSGQMAISLDNALLNEQLEQRVEERTRQLSSQQQILLEKNQELQTLNAEKDELLSIVAHDLRNPLRQIKNMLGQVLLKGDSASDQKEYIELSLKAAERLQQMISQIIRIDALDMQRITLELETVDMELLLEEALAEIQLQAAEKELVLEVLLPDEPFELELDRRYCLRVLSILLSNALKYSPYGSKIYVSLFADDGQLTIEIRDEGPGISQKEQKRLFSKFQVLHQPIEEGDGFSGLSLAQAKQYVEAMGGELGCSSELGEGSVFYLIFPFH